ncbi:MAG: hypothetical protein ABIG44_17735 [Planctomycetota bacterium]
MPTSETPTPARIRWGPFEIAATVFFALSVGAWLVAFRTVYEALTVLAKYPNTHASIGATIVVVYTLAIGAPVLLVSVTLAIFARGLPMVFRILSILPGAAAVLAGITTLLLAYAYS